MPCPLELPTLATACLPSHPNHPPCVTSPPRASPHRYHCLSSYLIELALQETDCLRWLPSMVAASAICLARVTLSIEPYWSPQLQAFSAYDASAVRACIVELHSLHRKATSATLRAVFDKYATPAFLGVSTLSPLETLPPVLDDFAGDVD